MKKETQEGTQSFFKRGAATLCLLSLLSKNEMYGYEIVQAMENISGGRFCLPEGTLYPILYRLEDSGYLETRHVLVGKRMKRVYYRLSAAGMEHYNDMLEDYRSIQAGVKMILSHSGEEKEEERE